MLTGDFCCLKCIKLYQNVPCYTVIATAFLTAHINYRQSFNVQKSNASVQSKDGQLNGRSCKLLGVVGLTNNVPVRIVINQ